MEALIKASKAFEMTKNAVEKKYDEAIRNINDGILAATEHGANEVTIFFDNPLPVLIEDRVCEALEDAGYHIESWGVTGVSISWADVEADEPPTRPTAADVYTKIEVNDLLAADVDTNTAAGTEVVDESVVVSNDLFDEYGNYVEVPLGYIRDWIHDSMYYHALVGGGVENWEWYGEAITEFCNEEHAHDMDEVINEYMQSCLKDYIIVK